MENYCGGFEGIKDEFTFSYFDKNREEFWFQIYRNTLAVIQIKLV
jgi:hypothetical protein